MVKESLRVLGEAFKEKRKEKNFTLKEAENATSIRSNYLEAIEEGQFNKLISPIYAQGFFRQYAIFLGLDPEEMIKKNPDVFVKGADQEFSYGIGTLEVRGNPGANVRWFPNIMWVLVTLGVLIAAFFMARYLDVL